MVSVVATPTTNRDSLRASVFDVCLELGALDENSLVAEWMFNDPSSDGANIDDDRRTIGQESISIGWEDTVRASAFAARLKQKGKSRQKTNDSAINRDTSHEFGTGHISLNRRTFFQRTARKSDTGIHRDKIAFTSPSHTGLISTNPKSFFRLKTRSTTGPPNTRNQPEPNLKASASLPTPDADLQASSSGTSAPVQVTSLGEDDDWEEIEARPQSPLYALKNKGINPAPVVLTKKKRFGNYAKYNNDIEHAPEHYFSPNYSISFIPVTAQPSKIEHQYEFPTAAGILDLSPFLAFFACHVSQYRR
ncbi:hypothetical protein BDZ94DRAFT_1233606 [Collybia nuda]|uniref:Uncharacterized protein n=1 Tax=Collybia nuda TaxID=64659 RepID=A0A9P5YDX4_9AGAR|nr:hypothetical protein BDZ94DRAFT_1233606 [Collybia nuda]